MAFKSKEREKEYLREWSKKNRKHLNKYSIAWRKKNLERSKEIKRKSANKIKG